MPIEFFRDYEDFDRRLIARKLVYVLRELEAYGFTAMTFSDDDILVPRRRGILIDKP